MSFKVYINNGGGLGEIDVTRYVGEGSIKITKSLNLPSVCAITLNGYDNQFVLPVLRSYMRIYSTQSRRNIFTGILTTDPGRSFQGLNRNVPGTNFQMYAYQLNYTSEEYILNIKQVDFIPAFINRSQGQILKTLADTLAPGYFDTSAVASGDLVPYLQYDPSKTWSDYAKQFCDSSKYRYSCQDHQIRFQPYGDGPLGIEYDDDSGHDGKFDPSGLTTSAMTTQIVNDVTVIGQQEAGDHHEDYFIGDGFTGAFPLKHKVYGLSSSFAGSSVLLSDGWNNGQSNSSNWDIQDPAAQFNYVGGALNIISGFGLPPGLSYIKAHNALELAGGVVMQHGEIEFNDRCQGVIGGVYDDENLNYATCEAGFQIASSAAVVVTASGASGIEISPFRLGAVPDKSFQVLSKVNKSYTLFTKIGSPAPVRYQQIFRSISGYMYGGTSAVPNVSGTITWTVLEEDIFTGEITNYHFSLSGQQLPDTAVYGLINNEELNLSLSKTEIWTPPPGSLGIQCEIGAGLLAPIYISGNVQYTGAFVTPSGGHLPIQQGSFDPISASGFGPEQLFDMGSGIGSQAAELDSGTLTDTLNFYSNDLPGVGTRIRLQTWESQAAISRVRDPNSIATEAAVVGDDGVRATVVNNLDPLPRTSEDCDNAAAAFLADRTGVFYQGTYRCSYLFFHNLSSDLEYYPTCGRFLKVNSPKRNIRHQQFLVTSLAINITEMMGEIVNYEVTFGPDTYLEKFLKTLMPVPTNTLTPMDTAIQLTPQQLSRVGFTYLPDVAMSTVTGQVSGDFINVSLLDTLPSADASFEIRSADLGQWGNADSTLIYRGGNAVVHLPRSQYDQTWFIRMVSGALIPFGGDNSLYDVTKVATSRRTKVVRVVYPQIPPLAPKLLTADTSFVQMDFAGDTRNVEGLELRVPAHVEIINPGPPTIIRFVAEQVVYQCIVGSRFDLGINMDQLRNKLLPGESGLDGLGQYLINPYPSDQRLLDAYFFNLMMEYGPALNVVMSAFQAPVLKIGYRWGPALQLLISLVAAADANRQDVRQTLAQISSGPSFLGTENVFIQVSQVGNPGFITSNVPVTGDLYARATFVDAVGSGAWSNTLHIPQGDLIASDYLASQGSVPPVVTSANGGSGGLFSYASTDSEIDMFSQAFSELFPNGAVDNIPPVSGAFTETVDTNEPLTALTAYGFFPAVQGPTTSAPTVFFNGPYLNYTTATGAITGMVKDGFVPLTNGAFVVQTSAPTGTGGGGGGGSDGGDTCGTKERVITLANDFTHLGKLKPGTIVMGTNGARQRVRKTTLVKDHTYLIEVESGLQTRGSKAHTFKRGEHWITLGEILTEIMYEDVYVRTVNSEQDKVTNWIDTGEDWIVKIELEQFENEECDHTYLLDGFWTHNVWKY